MKVTQLYGIGIITAAVLVATAAPQKYTHSLEQRVENLEQLVVQQQAEIERFKGLSEKFIVSPNGVWMRGTFSAEGISATIWSASPTLYYHEAFQY